MTIFEILPLTLYWVFPLVLLLNYYIYDLFVTRKVTQKLGDYPIVGKPSRLASRVILNLIFAGNAARLLETGYRKFKDKAFQIIRNDGNVVILPLSTIDELSSLPPTVASPHGALEHDLLGPYTNLDIILESRLHHSIIQRKLTPRLGLLTPILQDELRTAFKRFFPVCEEGLIEIQPFQILGRIAAQLSARALVGYPACRDPAWIDISINYTENLFKTIVILRMFPNWMHPFLSRCLPSYWAGKRYVKAAKKTLGPRFRELILKNDEGSWSPEAKEEDFHVLAWLADAAKGSDRNPDTLAHVEILLALASVHTTLLRMVNVLYDIIEHPEYWEILRDECRAVEDDVGEWSEASYQSLHKLDSVLRESQRLSPPTILGLKRVFKQSYTFANGLSIPKGTYVALPITAIENDPDHTASPDTFDGLRSYRLFLKCRTDNESLDSVGVKKRNSADGKHQFSSLDRTVLNFGYGRSACPGRHFASLVIKMTMVKLLNEYDFKFLPNSGRPRNYVVHEFLFPWPWDKILVKKRTN